MKQHITEQQLNELTFEQRQNLREWWKPQRGDNYFIENEGIYTLANDENEKNRKNMLAHDGIFPLLSIGQMIDIIYNNEEWMQFNLRRNKIWEFEMPYKYTEQAELCDALWQAVKAIL